MYDLITVGDIKLDTFIVIPDAHVMCALKMPECQLCIAYGTKIPVDAIASQIAGSASNVAVGVAKMKKSPAVKSVMAEDGTHTLALDFLSHNNVDSRLIETSKTAKSSFAVVLGYKGESTQLVALGRQIYRLPMNTAESAWIHISELGEGYEKLYADAAHLAKSRGTKLSVNPGAVQITEKKKELLALLRATTVLFLNRSEARELLGITKEDEIHHLLAAIKKLGPKYVVVTDGKNGAYALDGNKLFHVPTFPGELVEATGAGDAFATGFLGALMHDKSHDEGLRWGSVNAASVIGCVGPTEGLLTVAEIRKRLNAHPSYKTVAL